MKFDLTTVDTLQGLHAYMNTMINNNEEILSYCLKKVSHYWGYKEGNYVYYMLAPPWVRIIIVTFYLSKIDRTIQLIKQEFQLQIRMRVKL